MKNLIVLIYVLVPLSERGSTADDGNNFALMTTLMIMAVILFIFRPNAWRRRRNVDEKQPSNNNGEVSTDFIRNV